MTAYTPAEDVCEALGALYDIRATVEDGPAPTEVEVAFTRCADPSRSVILKACRDLNRDDGGWEAVVDRDGEQVGLEDGPLADAPAADVAAWIQSLIAGGFRPA